MRFASPQQVMFDVRPTAKAPNQDPIRSKEKSRWARPVKVQNEVSRNGTTRSPQASTQTRSLATAQRRSSAVANKAVKADATTVEVVDRKDDRVGRDRRDRPSGTRGPQGRDLGTHSRTRRQDRHRHRHGRKDSLAFCRLKLKGSEAMTLNQRIYIGKDASKRTVVAAIIGMAHLDKMSNMARQDLPNAGATLHR